MEIDINRLIKDFDYLLKKETENKFFIRKSSTEKAKEDYFLIKSLFKEATELFEQKYILYFHEAMESASESRYNVSKDFDKQKALEIRDKALEFRKECLRILNVK
ncbi:hypothetical protein HZC30_06955 [Candidatus Woesearchaeota archaeon]|nr:hypothetical protein [Candidatus Woesearchaeota archaeon]